MDDRVVWEGNGLACTTGSASGCTRIRMSGYGGSRVVNRPDRELPCDTVIIQDLGLGEQGFLMNNEAYASQYLDHFIAQHHRMNFVLMSRQNLSQGGIHHWTAHGCLEGAAGFATDFRQLMGPAYRDVDYEAACRSTCSERLCSFLAARFVRGAWDLQACNSSLIVLRWGVLRCRLTNSVHRAAVLSWRGLLPGGLLTPRPARGHW
jgi:hypothetical protein